LRYIDILKKYDLKIEVGKNDLIDGVNLMTAHGSKGLEFEYVFITNFIDSR
jgi:superfamily I DNA/RNA helicase